MRSNEKGSKPSKEPSKTKIALFLGAGASSIYGYPTTQRFIEELKDKLGKTVEGNLLNDLLKVPHIKDVEHVIELLESMQVFTKHPLKEFVSTFPMTQSFGHTGFNVNDELRIIENLMDRIRDDVYRQYEFLPSTIEQITEAYFPLFEMIFEWRNDIEVPVFTTNYDCVVEEFCHSNEITCIDGFKLNTVSNDFEWNPAEFKKKPSKRKTLVKLYKLHGSLNWRMRSDSTIVRIGAEERTRGSRRYKQNLLIYPAEKMKPDIEPFGKLHELFTDEFINSDLAIFIGFSFRDQYLNDVIKHSSGKTKVIIVSPHASKAKEQFKTTVYKADHILPIDASFGEPKLMEQIAKQIVAITADVVF